MPHLGNGDHVNAAASPWAAEDNKLTIRFQRNRTSMRHADVQSSEYVCSNISHRLGPRHFHSVSSFTLVFVNVYFKYILW